MKKIDLTPVFTLSWLIVFLLNTIETINLVAKENKITEITHFYIMLFSGIMLILGIILSIRNRK